MQKELGAPTQPVDTRSRRQPQIAPGMPIVVSYAPMLAVVSLVEQGTESYFVTSHAEPLSEALLDAAEIRDSFLTVKTARAALAFLRDVGDFLPGGVRFSWREFQEWQRLAYLVMSRTALAEAYANPTAAPDELIQVLRLLGGWPHTFFSDPAALPRNPESPALTPRLQLELWFSDPHPSRYWVQLIPSHNRASEAALDDAAFEAFGNLIEYKYLSDQLQAVLQIAPKCAVEAIAGAIFADRLATVHYEKCNACGRLFPASKGKGKKTCGSQCKARLKKRGQRARAKTRQQGD